MPPGLNFAVGFRRLIDAQEMYMRNGFPCYLRLRNFPDLQSNLAAQMGFVLTPTGASGAVGTTDILIMPPPAVRSVSLHNIGQSQGKLRFGAKDFLVSSSFTDAQVKAQGLSEERLVWAAPNVVGLVTAGQLYSIEDIKYEQIAGKTVTWILTSNAADPPAR